MEDLETGGGTTENLCRFENKCKNKACHFNHLERPICRNGNSCPRSDCWYNHNIMLCRYDAKCTNKECKFRHPGALAIANLKPQGSSVTQNSASLPVKIPQVTTATQPKSDMTKNGNFLGYHCPSSKSIPLQLQTPKPEHSRNAHSHNREVFSSKKEESGTFDNFQLNGIVKKHNLQITSLTEEIMSFQSSEDFEIDNDKSKGTLEALRKKLSELQMQLIVYRDMYSRAQTLLTGTDRNHQIKREDYRLNSALPALAKRIDIENLIENSTSRFIIIQGQTGSGKSTQIAQYIADNPKFKNKRVVCTQPRKIAAITLANRVSMEYAGGASWATPGPQVGFQVGGKKIGGKHCRIEFVTEGVMLDRIMKGTTEAFQDVGCIVIDEAHERSIICDILLGTFKKEDPRWEDILIVVTSATIDLEEFSKFFNHAPTVEIEGRTFPVEVTYDAIPEKSDIRNEVVKCALQIHKSCGKSAGDILCFLPGQEDVLLAQAAFETEVTKLKLGNHLAVSVFALYGRQDPEKQNEVFKSLNDNGTRKVIFATDIAETSITIDGIVYVVDSGIKKEMAFDPKRNISSLRINTISKSSAIQRAGRSGRTQPGHCYRLYSRDDFDNMSISTAPEIFRRPLSLAILSLRDMKLDPAQFDWISAPSREAILAAEEELRLLSAIDKENKLTELGKLISQSQQEPKLVRMIYRGCQDGLGSPAITIASILTVSNMFFWNGTDPESKSQAKKQRQVLSNKEGDIVTMYRLFEEWLKIRETSVANDQAKQDADVADLSIILQNQVILGIRAADDSLIVKSPSSTNELSEIIKPNKSTRVKINKKEAAEWCRKNFINGKALGLILTTNSELLSLFKHTKTWMQRDVQDMSPSDLDIKRLVFSGYFLNTARLIYGKKSFSHQYYAVHPEVVGKLDFKAAITNYENVPNKSEFCPPKWIVYDKILRIFSTIFPTTSPIEDSWIKNESEEFYNLCQIKIQSLPTEKVAILTSQECLRSIFGKHFVNLNSLEHELGCSLDVNSNSGELEAYCSVLNKPMIEESIKLQISEATAAMTKQVIEEEYLGGTRVVIGKGYEIQEILFPQEYTTLFIRNLPGMCTKEYLSWKIERLHRPNIIRTIEITEHETSNNSAVVKFFSKTDAKVTFEALKGEMVQGQLINAVPSGLGPKKGVAQGESTRLKISWAIAPSTGKANIVFNCPSEANTFLSNVSYLFTGARVSNVHGEMQSRPRNFVSKKPLPPTMSIMSRVKGASNIRFVEEDLDQNFDFEYKVTVVDLRKDIDEHEVLQRVKHIAVPKWVNIDRVKQVENIEYETQLMKERSTKLRPIEKYITGSTITTDFFEKHISRAGMYVYLDDTLKAQEAFRQADYFSVGDSFEQPHRIEIERTHATSVHIDLYNFMKKDIETIKKSMQQRGVVCFEFAPKNNKAKFITLKFRSCNEKLIREAQKQLEDISNCTKFVYENMELLFTWTGRIELIKLAKRTFIHWNYKTHGIWIYGRPTTQQEVCKQLQQIVNHLKSLEEIDKPFVLDKKNIDITKPKDLAKVSRICERCQLTNFHVSGNRVFASGSKSTLERLEKELESNKYLFRRHPSRHLGSSNLPDCSVCFCSLDPNFILTSVCGHAFCIECIQPMFDIEPLQYPVKCQGQDCQMPLVINDIAKCAPPGRLRKFVEYGVIKYQEDHAKDIFFCPKPGCNQILFSGCRTSGKYGGDFYFCDECVATYCLSCSKLLDKPVKSHENETCGDIQNGLSDSVTMHVKHIQEKIFNLCCPRCNTVFFDFTGCAAVTCDSCKCAFCGICLKDCGLDSHPHVTQCSKNPRKGEYFISEAQLHQIHRKMRISKLCEYLRGIEDSKTRADVHRVILKDVMDLGISEQEIGI